LTHLPETTTVVILDEAIGPLGDAFPEAKVMRFEVLKGPALRQWAEARVKESGVRFAPGALERLLTLVDGAHLGELANEIEKLSTYALGRTVTMEDIEAMASSALQLFGYNLTDAIVDGRADRAFHLLDRMDAKSWPPVMLMAMIRRQYRQLLLAQALLLAGRSGPQIGDELGLRGFPLEKTIGNAARFQGNRLEQAYRRILKADVDVKTGIMDAETVLPALIVELTELSRPGRAAAATRRR
jgi:DNA polymerase III subunit delta